MDNPSENNKNRQNENLLERFRQSNNDEGVEYAINKGMKLGNSFTELIGVPLLLLCTFMGQMLTVYALLTLYSAHCIGEFLAKYRYFKQKRYLIGMIIFGVLLGCLFAALFVREMGFLQGWWS